MTPEELAETIDGANVNYAPDISCDDWQAMAKALLAHINQQAAEVERLRSENEALNEKLIEAKAKEIYPFNIPHWDNLPEEDTVGKLCPTVTRRGKAYWRKEATRQLAEEMPEVDWQ